MPSEISPKVFISYSHDSPEHRDWVRSFAERLLNDGVYVVLDEWDIEPGDDVTAFMERGLASCDRVLIICTEEYLTKANTLKGGVGYERMIITAEVAKQLETKKFIPVLRRGTSESLPVFLGNRMYVDFRFDDAHYETLARSLLESPKYKRPPLGRNPFQEDENQHFIASDDPPKNLIKPESNMELVVGSDSILETEKEWKYHWHAAVHRHYGNKLYIIFLRFATGSIFLKPSIEDDLRQSGISDYMIFNLYSHWDILIRAWASDDSIENLKRKFSSNPDLHRHKAPEYSVVESIIHLPNGIEYPTDAQVKKFLDRDDAVEQLEDVQANGKTSKYFDSLYAAGFVMDNSVRFDERRIQFYITISSHHALEAATTRGIERIMKSAEGIFNRSIYKTSGAIRAIIKGQVQEYYDIHQCLRNITEELEDRLAEGVVTETMLVANRVRQESTTIDFDRVETHIFDQEFKRLFPAAALLRLTERRHLEFLFAEIRGKLPEDKEGIFIRLIQAKSSNSPEQFGTLATFFSSFEELLKKKLVPLILATYNGEWQSVLDRLKEDEKIGAKDYKQFVLGDLSKVYRRIILERQMIDFSPLSEIDFRKLMDEIPPIRNVFAHTKPDLSRWDEVFSFCKIFVPIHSRLTAYLEHLPIG
jgi:hypothetical protein